MLHHLNSVHLFYVQNTVYNVDSADSTVPDLKIEYCVFLNNSIAIQEPTSNFKFGLITIASYNHIVQICPILHSSITIIIFLTSYGTPTTTANSAVPTKPPVTSPTFTSDAAVELQPYWSWSTTVFAVMTSTTMVANLAIILLAIF
jgi:hypothetical protein